MNKSDYQEPRCPMDNSMWTKKKVTPIPTDRIIAKEDEYFAKNDYQGAEKHLLYWWKEAEEGNDDRGKLVLCNELMGLYRKLGKGESAKAYSGKALEIVKLLELENTISGATAFLNSGTVYKAFGEPEKSLNFFSEARKIYEKILKPDDSRLAGLYNNTALTLADLKRYAEARELYMKAIDIVKNICKADEAISWLNLADLTVAEKGLEDSSEQVKEYTDRAEALLEGIPDSERDSYYAYVCEKCAPVFDYYGYFITAQTLKKRSEEIYASNRN